MNWKRKKEDAPSPGYKPAPAWLVKETGGRVKYITEGLLHTALLAQLAGKTGLEFTTDAGGRATSIKISKNDENNH